MENIEINGKKNRKWNTCSHFILATLLIWNVKIFIYTIYIVTSKSTWDNSLYNVHTSLSRVLWSFYVVWFFNNPKNNNNNNSSSRSSSNWSNFSFLLMKKKTKKKNETQIYVWGNCCNIINVICECVKIEMRVQVFFAQDWTISMTNMNFILATEQSSTYHVSFFACTFFMLRILHGWYTNFKCFFLFVSAFYFIAVLTKTDIFQIHSCVKNAVLVVAFIFSCIHTNIVGVGWGCKQHPFVQRESK